jgi:hypothetical protein
MRAVGGPQAPTLWLMMGLRHALNYAEWACFEGAWASFLNFTANIPPAAASKPARAS